MPRFFEVNEDPSRGFTLLEVLVAIVILTVALLGTASLVGSIIGYNQLADQVTTATTLAQDKIEEFKNSSYSSITDSSEEQSIYTISSDVEDSPDVDMKTIKVTVSWRWKGSLRNVVLKTIIGG